MSTVGVVGAGLMGTACARRLMQAGFEVLAYDVDAVKRAAIAKGMRTLRMDGWEKCVMGQTSIEEVMRLTQEDGGGGH